MTWENPSAPPNEGLASQRAVDVEFLETIAGDECANAMAHFVGPSRKQPKRIDHSATPAHEAEADACRYSHSKHRNEFGSRQPGIIEQTGW